MLIFMSILTNKNKKGNAVQIELLEGPVGKIVVQSETESLEYICDMVFDIINAILNKKCQDVYNDELYG